MLVVSYGNRAVDDTFLEMADVLAEGGFVPVALGSFVAHHSLMTNVAVGRPDADDLAAVRALSRPHTNVSRGVVQDLADRLVHYCR